jgi:hypothetical protein
MRDRTADDTIAAVSGIARSSCCVVRPTHVFSGAGAITAPPTDSAMNTKLQAPMQSSPQLDDPIYLLTISRSERYTFLLTIKGRAFRYAR